MSMNMKLMMKEDANGDMQFVCKGTADTLGTAVPIDMFYTDGYMYVNTMGIKYRQAMDLEAAKAQATQINMDLDTDVVKGLRMYTSGDTRKLAFTIDDQKINEVLTAVTSATAETYEELGVTLDMKINESNGEMTVNKDGYCEAMKMFMDYGMSVTDHTTSEADEMNYKMDINMTYKNPGKEVYFEIPSTDGYEDIAVAYMEDAE